MSAGLKRVVEVSAALDSYLRRLVASDAIGRQVLTLAMQPRPEDYAAVFRADCVPAAARYYDSLWLRMRALSPAPEQRDVHISAAFAETLVSPGVFPGGYARVADSLVPGVVWLCGRFLASDEKNGLAFDGIVAREERWIWLPKPWRVLVNPAVSHWAD